MDTFADVQNYFLSTYGEELVLVEEPYAMAKNKGSTKWVGLKSPNKTLLRRNGKITSRYTKIKYNGGRRPVSLSTLLSNIKEGRPLFISI